MLTAVNRRDFIFLSVKVSIFIGEWVFNTSNENIDIKLLQQENKVRLLHQEEKIMLLHQEKKVMLLHQEKEVMLLHQELSLIHI